MRTTASTPEYGWEPRGRWSLREAIECGAGADLTPRPAPKFRSPGLYVAYCRRRYPEVFGDNSPARGGLTPDGAKAPDGRLIAAAWNRLPPSRWVDIFSHFLDYWNEAIPRPDVVGSEYNIDPELIFEAWENGFPAYIVRSLGDRICTRSRHVRRWDCLPRRARRRLALAARAATRASARKKFLVEDEKFYWWVAWHEVLDLGALALLGRLCPDEQRAILDEAHAEGLIFKAETVFGVNDFGGKIRSRDLIAIKAIHDPEVANCLPPHSHFSSLPL